jgi:hypothetical protein
VDQRVQLLCRVLEAVFRNCRSLAVNGPFGKCGVLVVASHRWHACHRHMQFSAVEGHGAWSASMAGRRMGNSSGCGKCLPSTLECLAIEERRAFRGEDAVHVRDNPTPQHGAPRHIRADNDLDLISWVVKSWCKQGGTGTLYIDRGSRWQNGTVASSNGRLRDELSLSEIFDTLAEGMCPVHRRRMFCNHGRI